MIECVFTIDYEIYGDGRGTLTDLVYAPTERMREIFRKWGVRFVPFVEVAELEVIEAQGSDPGIELVKRQIHELHQEGCFPGLHLHPQWYNARYERQEWALDYAEYNLCTLPKERIMQIVDRAIAYIQRAVGDPSYVPLAFRAGNWLFQPTPTAAAILWARGVKVDSSVFKGGVRHEHGLDYRQALANGYYWWFREQADTADPSGAWLELPIYTRMVPFWKMASAKRVAMESAGMAKASLTKRLYRARDLCRFRHPLKLDFCRMTLDELITNLAHVVHEERRDPSIIRPVVLIGHTKELADYQTLDGFLSFLSDNAIGVSTFEDVYARCLHSRQDRRS